jgi:hypothetical protein
VNFSGLIGLSQKVDALRIIHDAVDAIGQKLNNELLHPRSSSEAFKTVLGSEHIITVSSNTCGSDNNCTRGDLVTGAEMHLLTSDLLRPNFGKGLIIHEFGHLFTNDADFRKSDGTINQNQVGGNTAGWNSNGGDVNASRMIYDFLWVFGYDNTSEAQSIAAYNFPRTYSGDGDYWKSTEATADAFATWILNDFVDKAGGCTADQARRVVTYFFRNIFQNRGNELEIKNPVLKTPAKCIQ